MIPSTAPSWAVDPLLLAIDPGSVQTALVVMYDDKVTGRILPNAEALQFVYESARALDDCAIEMVASYGMAVGKDVFETVFWIGRFAEAWRQVTGRECTRIYRKDVKMTLCQNLRANDSNIRQALIDRYGPGKDKAIGRKATPGPLYGFKSDMWAALGVGVTFLEQRTA